jgi:pyruvate carboxylase
MKLLVKEGDDVKEGDPIAVLEAMKMETNVLATATGKLAKFNVKEGQQVVAGELIATIE